MSPNMNIDKKKLLPIAYCVICLLISITFLTCDIVKSYNLYLSGEYQLRVEARIINFDNINFLNGNPGRDYSIPTLIEKQVGTEVYIFNLHSGTCDIDYRDKYDRRAYANNVPIENLEVTTDDYKLLSGEKRYSITEYLQRIITYTPIQMKKWLPSGALEKKIWEQFRVFAFLLIFDLLYIIYKTKSKKYEFTSLVMNGIMYISSTLCLLISVLGIYIV